MKRTLTFLLVLLFATTICALCLSSCASGSREFRFEDYLYTLENKEVTITEYTGTATHINIPESIDGMPVVAIDTSAFHHSKTIKSVTFPDSVVRIGSLVFNECYDLERVTLGRGIREIDFSPFAKCNKLEYNEYENGYYLGNNENPYLALVSVKSQDIESLVIHPDTLVICGCAIERCKLLKEIEIPEGVVSIGSFAFQYCSSLETVYIPKTVEFIDLKIFKDCASIQNIVVSPENQYYKSENGSLFSRDGSRLIRYAAGQNVSSYHVPYGTVIIEDNAFEKANYLTEVTLPESVEVIEHSAFLSCENLRDVYLDNGLKTIGGLAFGFCSSIEKITIPDSVEELCYSAFSNCSKLESVVIGNGVISIEIEAFVGCDSLKEIVFKDPDGWKINASYSLSSNKIDASDPKQNAEYLTGTYCEYYWRKK